MLYTKAAMLLQRATCLSSMWVQGATAYMVSHAWLDGPIIGFWETLPPLAVFYVIAYGMTAAAAITQKRCTRPSIGAFVKGFRDAGKLGVASSSSVKASREEAEAETSVGLRPKKRKSDSTTDTEPPPTKKTNKGGKSQDKLSRPKEGEEVKYGKLDGTLRQPKVPDAAEMETMCQRGLVILSTPDKPLFLNTSWSNKKLNAKFKQLLPGPIGFCEKHPYAGDTDASPEIREQIADHCKIPGRSPSDWVVYLVSKVRIPKPRWSWEEQSDSEDLGSDIETVPSEDLVRTPRKPLRKGKGKVKSEPKIKSEPDPEAEEDEPDMRKAAKMRTRLSTDV
ncbi:hypothetical protein B0H14DRAFT_3762246 [Mycena olivaceomarginata]|nr:hypothetical protein B0H14DRAFT_3762246 [Mycena olivaceomarginata]